MNEKGYSVEQVRTQQKEKLSILKSDETRVRAEIELKEKSLAELQSIDYDVIEKQIAEIKKQIEDIDNTLLGKAEAIKPILGQRDAIFEIINSKTLKLNESRNTYNNKFNALRNDINAQIRNVAANNDAIRKRNEVKQSDMESLKRQVELMKVTISTLTMEKDRLAGQRDMLKSRVFTDDKCAYCGQELPADVIEEKRKQFNERKQNELDSIVTKGKTLKKQIEDTEKDLQAKLEIINAGVELEQFENTDALYVKLDELNEQYVPYESTEEYHKMFNEIETLKSTLPEIPQSDNEGLTNMKRSLITELETQNRMYGKKQDIIDTMNKIEALKSDLRNICNEEARIEGLLVKITEYVEEKANIVSSRVNDRLSICKIQMYRVQKDGGIAPDCRVYSKEGVPFSTINNSKAMLIRIDLQRFFCNHFNVQLPIFVDEYKSFDDFNAPKSQGEQMIMLYASNSPILEVK
jgi:chromosome segregation ATPase